MAKLLSEFVGTFTFRHGDSSLHPSGAPLIRPGFLLCLGTGKYQDPQPDGIRIGLSVVDPNTGKRTLPAEGHPPAFAYLVDGTLNGSTYWLADQMIPELMSYQISLLTLYQDANKPAYRSATMNVTIGDPRNAGVWGAEDSGNG